jgi:hypothetical protein
MLKMRRNRDLVGIYVVIAELSSLRGRLLAEAIHKILKKKGIIRWREGVSG